MFGVCRRRNGPYYPTKPPQKGRYIVNYNAQFAGFKHETTKNFSARCWCRYPVSSSANVRVKFSFLLASQRNGIYFLGNCSITLLASCDGYKHKVDACYSMIKYAKARGRYSNQILADAEFVDNNDVLSSFGQEASLHDGKRLRDTREEP